MNEAKSRAGSCSRSDKKKLSRGEERLNRENMEKNIIKAYLLFKYGDLLEADLTVGAEGKYFFRTPDQKKSSQLYISVENETFKIGYEKGDSSERTELFYGHFDDLCGRVYCVPLEKAGDGYFLYLEQSDQKIPVIHRFHASQSMTLTIGRNADADLRICDDILGDARVVPANNYEASLSFADGAFSIMDAGSSMGVYVNGQAVRERRLHLGDLIFVAGVRIVIGTDFFAIPDIAHLSVQSRQISPYCVRKDLLLTRRQAFSEEETIYYQTPRRRAPMEIRNIEVQAPPFSMQASLPAFMRLGSSLAMGATSLLMGYGLYSMIGSLFPVLSAGFTEKQRKEYEEKRVERYTSYLAQKEREIEDEEASEEQYLRAAYPPLEEIVLYPQEGKRMWEGRKTDPDFLKVRIGQGNIPMLATLTYPKENDLMQDDPMVRNMYALVKEKRILEKVPVQLDLPNTIACGVLGHQAARIRFVQQFVQRLSTLYSAEDLRMIFLMDQKTREQVPFAGALPHVWNKEHTQRFLAEDEQTTLLIHTFLQGEFEDVLSADTYQGNLNKRLQDRPYYIVIATSRMLYDAVPALKKLLSGEESVGISLLAVFDDLPGECRSIIHVNENMSGTLESLVSNEKPLAFRMDGCNRLLAEDSMRIVANSTLEERKKAASLPKMVTFLEMYGVGRAEHLNIEKRWTENNSARSLAAPIGIREDGSLFTLDLHQKFQGPHGLVAGMTGSGKSEFLITYILSLAVNFSPNEVSFLLIDYKGGGLAGAFDDEKRGVHLPHLAGTITNLDAGSMNRCMVSLNSELKRREIIFNEARSVTGESNMDIYSYTKLYKAGRLKEPLPHLFIISDEFAELKQQQPDFMDDLISIARVGRSLGVHLILATQKPSGIVNDQILSNMKFRVCLKVQDRPDSMDMLGRGDAASLRDTGRFYLMVGYNEYFALGQSAWCGADYVPHEEVVRHPDESVQIIDLCGQEQITVQPPRKKEEAQGSQVDAIIRHLTEIAKEGDYHVRPLWMQPLALGYSMQDHPCDHSDYPSVRLFVGMVDEPQKQRQFPYTMDFLSDGNLLICGEHESGKTTLVQSLLLMLSASYTSDQVNYYVLDYSSQMLKIFSALPHCGAVVGIDQADKIKPFFELIDSIVKTRRKLFEAIEADSFETASRRQKLPMVFVIIDNIAGMEDDEEAKNIAYELDKKVKSSAAYGIRYIVTCNQESELNARLEREFSTRIALHLNNAFSYYDLLGVRCTFEPPALPGRGAVRIGKQVMEIQVARAASGLDDLKDKVAVAADHMKNKGRPAQRMKSVSRDQTYGEFMAEFEKNRIPLGYDLESRKALALPLVQMKQMALYFGNPQSTIPVLTNLLMEAGREAGQVIILKSARDSVFRMQGRHRVDEKYFKEARVFSVNDEVKAFSDVIVGLLQDRVQVAFDACQKEEVDHNSPEAAAFIADDLAEAFPPVFVLIENFMDLCNAVQDKEDMQQRLQSILILSALCKIYVLGGFYPDDQRSLRDSSMAGVFNKEHLTLLFGGRLESQSLINVPFGVEGKNQVGAFDRFLMHYRGEDHACFMPCKSTENNEEDPDMASIFL